MPTNSQFWNQASIEPKRQFRWLLYLSGMPQFIVTDVKKPSFNIASQAHTFLNYEFYYPGKVTWTDVNFSIVDPVQPDSAASLVKILEAAGYVVPDQYTSQAGFPKTISKKAMVDCYAEGLLPMLTVHDELCFNIENDKQVKRITEIMTTCVPNLNIPFEVDSAIVDNWGEVE